MKWQEVTITPEQFRKMARPCKREYNSELGFLGLTENEEVPVEKALELLAKNWFSWRFYITDHIILSLPYKDLKDQTKKIVDLIFSFHGGGSYHIMPLTSTASNYLRTSSGRLKRNLRHISKAVEARREVKKK